MASRFDYVKYDAKSIAIQDEMKARFVFLEQSLSDLKDGRAKSLILTKLEEAYMWIGKAIRDDQIARNGSAGEQPERKNG